MKSNKVTDKQLLLHMRDKERKSFQQLADFFGCSKQGVHNVYYRAKVKSMLPITIRQGDNKTLEIKNINEANLECYKKGKTLVEFVQEEIEHRFIKEAE